MSETVPEIVEDEDGILKLRENSPLFMHRM
jgi:hypothetical protein